MDEEGRHSIVVCVDVRPGRKRRILRQHLGYIVVRSLNIVIFLSWSHQSEFIDGGCVIRKLFGRGSKYTSQNAVQPIEDMLLDNHFRGLLAIYFIRRLIIWSNGCDPESVYPACDKRVVGLGEALLHVGTRDEAGRLDRTGLDWSLVVTGRRRGAMTIFVSAKAELNQLN